MNAPCPLVPLRWSWNALRPAPGWLDDFPATVPVVWLAWTTAPDASVSELMDGLSPEERARWERFRQEADRRRFLVGRGLLRILAGAQLKLPPERVEFTYGPQGKPSFAPVNNRPPMNFNLSHSGDLVVLAFHLTRAVGVDVEQVRPDKDWEAVASRFFPADEYARWAALAPADRVPAFFKNWTRREAALKALGLGIGHTNQTCNDCTRFDLELPPGYAGAVTML